MLLTLAAQQEEANKYPAAAGDRVPGPFSPWECSYLVKMPVAEWGLHLYSAANPAVRQESRDQGVASWE